MLKSDFGAVISGLEIKGSGGEFEAVESSLNILGRDFASGERNTVEGKLNITRYGGAVRTNLGVELRVEGDLSLGSLKG